MKLSPAGLEAAQRARGRLPMRIVQAPPSTEAIITAYLRAAGFSEEKEERPRRGAKTSTPVATGRKRLVGPWE